MINIYSNIGISIIPPIHPSSRYFFLCLVSKTVEFISRRHGIKD